MRRVCEKVTLKLCKFGIVFELPLHLKPDVSFLSQNVVLVKEDPVFISVESPFTLGFLLSIIDFSGQSKVTNYRLVAVFKRPIFKAYDPIKVLTKDIRSSEFRDLSLEEEVLEQSKGRGYLDCTWTIKEVNQVIDSIEITKVEDDTLLKLSLLKRFLESPVSLLV